MAIVNSKKIVDEVDTENNVVTWLEFSITSNAGDVSAYRIPADWSAEDAQSTLDSYINDVDAVVIDQEAATSRHAWIDAL